MRPADRDSKDAGATSTVTAPIEQVLGVPTVGTWNNDASCDGCNESFREGQCVQVYAHRPAECIAWELARWYCRDCAGELRPTLGVMEATVHAYLGSVSDIGIQTHWFCLIEPAVEALSPPREGSRP